MAQSFVGKAETGTRRVAAVELLLLAKILDLDLNALSELVRKAAGQTSER